jgi:hypothetical protein
MSARSLLIASFLAFFALAAAAMAANPEPQLDFRTGKGRDVREWLGGMGFMFERAAQDPASARFSVTDQGLVMDALKPAQAIIALKKGHLENYRFVDLEWGVNKFPPGASYAQGRRNEAIMFYAFFGSETVDSGSIVVPDSPYFIALHLCENDTINKPEKGRFFHKGGRFICVAHPQPGEIVKTRFDLKKSFRDIYGFEAPPLYGIAFEFDTNGAPGGTASGFVRKIDFPSATYIRND